MAPKGQNHPSEFPESLLKSVAFLQELVVKPSFCRVAQSSLFVLSVRYQADACANRGGYELQVRCDLS